MLTGEVPFRGDNQVAVAMKHVREELPDIQYRRPEVSSALAAVLDRATAKDLGERYQTDRELIADLEEVLAIETARAGQVTGEATQVLRTLPAPARRRVPLRARTSMWAVIGFLVVAGAVFAAVLCSPPTAPSAAPATAAPTPPPSARRHGDGVSLGQAAAEDYDPFGGDGEHPEEAARILDRDDSTAWSTESYQDGLSKEGVGIVVDAKPGVVATRDGRPHHHARLHRDGLRGEREHPGHRPGDWTEVAPSREFASDEDVQLDTGGERFRYYLVWITALPEDEREGRDLRAPAVPPQR